MNDNTAPRPQERAAPQYQDLSRFYLPPEDRGRPKWFIFIWLIVQATLWRWSPRPLYGWRRVLLRCFGAEVGEGALIRPTAIVTYPWKLRIGSHSWIGEYSTLYSLGEIRIGSNVSVSHNTYLCTGYHDLASLQFTQHVSPIVVEDECWLANDVFVGPGVSIGRGTIVGARSSVFSSLPGGLICHGTPARPVRERPPSR